MSNEIARQACSFFLGRLQAEVLRLRAVAFPGRDPGPQKWLNLVDGLLETGRGYLGQAGARKTAIAVAQQLVADSEQLGEISYELLKHVAGADITQIPE